MTGLSVLISGAGIAGPTLAFWLSRAGISTTIIERAPSLPVGGQQIDVRGAALEVIKRMGLEDIVRQTATNEQGLAFVDSKGTIRAEFGVDKESGRSFSSDIEILRGELAKILLDSTEKSTEYIFGDSITGLTETETSVRVDFRNAASRDFDLVVAADGMRSGVRSLVLGSKANSAPQDGGVLKSLGQYTCYFTIPADDGDGAWAKWYNAPGRRCILTRPDQKGALRSYLSIMSASPAVANYYGLGVAGQKRLMRELFADAGWEAERVLAGMDAAPDFYMQEIAQVRMQSWASGRVAFVGDAGYCPSPISGVGTSLALVGAYNLAGTIAKYGGGSEYRTAFEEYERVMRPRVDKAQSLPPGAPAIANPQTWWGIEIMLRVLSLASKTGIANWLLSGPSKDDALPDYDM
ncbi:hypothetical protein MBLNU459_g4143t1 [Dothideomycetes sp. NU459]